MPYTAEWLESTICRNEYLRPRLLETALDDLRAEKLDTSWFHLPMIGDNMVSIRTLSESPQSTNFHDIQQLTK